MLVEILCFAGGYSLYYILSELKEQKEQQKKLDIFRSIGIYEYSEPMSTNNHSPDYYVGGSTDGKKINRTKSKCKSKKA